MRQALAFLPVLGIILAWATIEVLGIKAGTKPFIYGFVALFIAMVVQIPVQLWVVRKTGVKNGEIEAYHALILGTVAGVSQELVKYLFLAGHTTDFGAYLGFGFGTAEVVQFLPVAFNEDVLDEMSKTFSMTSQRLSVMGIVERYFATLFHMGTSILLTSGGLGILALFMVVHSIIDTLGILANIGKLEVKTLEIVFALVSAIVFILAIV